MKLPKLLEKEYGRSCIIALLSVISAALMPFLGARETAFLGTWTQLGSWLILLLVSAYAIYSSLIQMSKLRQSAERLIQLDEARWKVVLTDGEAGQLWCEQTQHDAWNLSRQLTDRSSGKDVYLFDTPPSAEQIVNPIRQRADVPTILRWAAPSTVMIGLVGTLYGLGSVISPLANAIDAQVQDSHSQPGLRGNGQPEIKGKLNPLREGFLVSMAGVLVSLGLSLLRTRHEREIDIHFADIEASLQRHLRYAFFEHWRPPTDQLQQAGIEMNALAGQLKNIFETIDKETRILVARNIKAVEDKLHAFQESIPAQIDEGIRIHTALWLQEIKDHEEKYFRLIANQEKANFEQSLSLIGRAVSFEQETAQAFSKLLNNARGDIQRFTNLLQRVTARAISSMRKSQSTSEKLEAVSGVLIGNLAQCVEAVRDAATTTDRIVLNNTTEIDRIQNAQRTLSNNLESVLIQSAQLLNRLVTNETGLNGIVTGFEHSTRGLVAAATAITASSTSLSQSATQEEQVATRLDSFLTTFKEYVHAMETHNMLFKDSNMQLQHMVGIDIQVIEELTRTLKYHRSQPLNAEPASRVEQHEPDGTSSPNAAPIRNPVQHDVPSSEAAPSIDNPPTDPTSASLPPQTSEFATSLPIDTNPAAPLPQATKPEASPYVDAPSSDPISQEAPPETSISIDEPRLELPLASLREQSSDQPLRSDDSELAAPPPAASLPTPESGDAATEARPGREK